MPVEEIRVGETASEQIPVKCQRDDDIGSRPYRKVHVGRAGEGCGSWVDHHQPGAAILRLSQIRNQVDAGDRRVDAPKDDQARLGIVLVGHRRHLAVERHVRGACRRRAERPCQPRRAPAPPERGIEVVLCHQSIRSAIGVGKDRLTSGGGLCCLHPIDDALEGFVPGHPPEPAFALAPYADAGVQQSIGSVNTLSEAAHLGADVATCHRVLF